MVISLKVLVLWLRLLFIKFVVAQILYLQGKKRTKMKEQNENSNQFFFLNFREDILGKYKIFYYFFSKNCKY